MNEEKNKPKSALDDQDNKEPESPESEKEHVKSMLEEDPEYPGRAYSY